MNNKGFTIVEILVVIAIVALLGTILAAIFVNTLKGSNKSKILANIKQNGQAVLEDMDFTIRGADYVICPIITTGNLAESDILLVKKEGIYTRYKFIKENTTTDSEANGIIQKDNPNKQASAVDSTRLETDAEFTGRVCSSDGLSLVTPVILTDTNSQSGVSVKSLLFTRRILPGSKDSVTVAFTLDHGWEAPTSVAGQIDPVEFLTTIGLR